MEDMWQKNATLSETNLRMLEDEILCDVTFLAGESRQAVKAHKFVLVSRSPVFYAMFCGRMAETGDHIPVPDIEADIVKELLRYMYTVVANITFETVMALMYAANKYDVTALVNDCRGYLQSNTTPENVCTILQQAHILDDRKLIEQCQEIIEKNAEAVLESEAFFLSSSTCLRSILEMEGLQTSEEYVYASCVKWAKQECKKRGKEENDTSCRDILGDMLYLIRFPCMSSATFTKLTCDSELLSAEEKVDIFQCISLDDRKCVRFNSVSRGQTKKTGIIIKRFDGHTTSTWHDARGGTDSITFSCSSNALLTGVGVYSNSKCTLKIVKGTTSLWHYELDVTDRNSLNSVIVVKFEAAVQLKKNTTYEVVQINHGCVNRHGMHGKPVISSDGFIVTFSSDPSTYSSVNSGQIPRLYFEIYID